MLFNHFSDRPSDTSLTALLATQCFITFVLLPLIALRDAGPWLLDLGHLIFAAVCAIYLTNHFGVRVALVGSLCAIAAGPLINRLAWVSTDPRMPHELIAFSAFIFNSIVTALAARSTFSDGVVNRHRILGAVLVYLNVAVLFSISYEMLETFANGAIRPASGSHVVNTAAARIAEFSYFSLATITTCGYGDLVPIHPVARSLANLEALFGQLFPATFVARLVALHLAQSERVHAPQSDAQERSASR